MGSKGVYETYEYIKIIAITAGVPLNDDTLQELLLEARGLVG